MTRERDDKALNRENGAKAIVIETKVSRSSRALQVVGSLPLPFNQNNGGVGGPPWG
jgi:hypothetical protein